MDAATYPVKEVQDSIAKYAVAVQINTAEPDDLAKAAMRELRLVWTPLLVWFDHHGVELRRSVGYVAPSSLQAEMALADAQAKLFHAEYQPAELAFLDVVVRWPGLIQAAEGQFWSGVAALRAGDRDRFLANWRVLKQTYGDTIWWEKASFSQV
ncbi:MAG: hypothetical protein ACYCOS_08310 [Sulfobacillus sp.]